MFGLAAMESVSGALLTGFGSKSALGETPSVEEVQKKSKNVTFFYLF